MAKLFWNTNFWYEQKEEEMSTNLSNLNRMLLESYVEQINEFVGKEVIKFTPKNVSQDVFDFLSDLCNAINRHKWQIHCVRKCPFRKVNKDNKNEK